MLLIRAAAASDPEMADLLAEADEQRRTRMRHNARRLRRRGWLRPGITLAQATDILWTYSSTELYDLLVIKSGWPINRYGQFVGDALTAALLPSRSFGQHRLRAQRTRGDVQVGDVEERCQRGGLGRRAGRTRPSLSGSPDDPGRRRCPSRR